VQGLQGPGTLRDLHQAQELAAVAKGVVAAGGGGDALYVGQGHGPDVRVLAQQLAEGRDRSGEAGVGRRRVEAGAGAGLDRLLDQAALGRTRQLVADLQPGERVRISLRGRRLLLEMQVIYQARLAAGRRDLVERGHGMAAADFAGVDLVVVEVLTVEQPRLVADEAVLPPQRRV